MVMDHLLERPGPMSQQNIHYFPGHMNKALKDITAYVKSVDLVVEIADARAPISSRNPTLTQMIGNKAHIVLLSKSDFADPAVTERWVKCLTAEGLIAIAGNLKKDKILAILTKASEPLIAAKRAKEAKLGMKKQPIRVMVIGVPNVGKSTFINSLAHKSIAIVGNKAGVTRSEQWIKISDDFTLLDTPGVLPMNYLDGAQAVRLAILGSMKEEVLPTEELAIALIAYLKSAYPSALNARFDIPDITLLDSENVLKRIAVRRGLLDGAEPSSEKAAYLLIKEYKDGILGRYSLEDVHA